MQRISDEEARNFGIEAKHDLMDNGERKFRLNCSLDGSSYCRTVASGTGAWQNSHYHKCVSEFYVVQSGWITYAVKKDGEFKLRLLRKEKAFLLNHTSIITSICLRNQSYTLLNMVVLRTMTGSSPRS